MPGLLLLTHSLRMVFGNLQAALRLSAVIYAVTVVAQFLYMRALFGAGGSFDVEALGDTLPPISVTIFFFVATFVGSIWIAVAWHRFVLLEEQSSSLLPKMHSKNMMEYLGVSFMIVLILMIPLAVLFLLLAALGAAVGGFSLLLYLPVVYLFLRLSPMLPAAALGRPLKMTDAYNVTAPMSKALWSLAVIEVAFSAISSLLAEYIFPSNMTFLVIENAILGWIVMMVNASLMTTIYGVSVEDRVLT